MPKMSKSTLQAMLAAQHADALAAASSSKLSSARADAMAYYNGDMSKDMPAPVGRSQAVSMDVHDAVEGVLPGLMEVFAGSDEVVKLEPVGPDDEQAAEQETDYINHVFLNQNRGYLVLQNFIKDALLSKVGIVKIWWEEEEREERETYYDKTVDEYALIVSNPDVEVVEHTEHSSTDSGGVGASAGPEAQPEAGGASGANGNPVLAIGQQAGLPEQNPMGQPGGPQQLQPDAVGQTLHDITVVTKKKHAQARVMGVPPEEFGIERGARSIQDCNYCFHKVVDRTESDLITQGYDEKQVKALPTYRAWTNSEEINRDTVDENASAGSDEVNSSARLVEVTEHYVRMDYEGNGKPCLYRVTTGGSQGQVLILDGKPAIEEFDAIPFASATPIVVPHRFYGRSLADLTMDIQRIKTALTRGALDCLYIAVNPKAMVYESLASENTLDDLLVSRPNQIVRAKMPGAVEYQVAPDVSGSVYPALEYMDSLKETRTGVTKQSQGIDANALQNQSATAVAQAYSASQARVRLIARNIAEGVRDMFWLLHATIKKHGDKAAVVRLRNNWVTVDPRNWKTRDDLTVHVGLGTGGRAQRVAELSVLAGIQEKIALGGMTNIVGPKQIYNTGKEMAKAIGAADPDVFFADPSAVDPQTGQLKNPPPPPQQDPAIIKANADMQVQAQKGQLEQQKSQADTQHQIAKTQADMALAERKFELEKELKLLDAQIKLKQHEMDMQKHNVEMQRDTQKHSLELHGKQIDTNIKLAEAGKTANEQGGVDVHPAVKEAVSGVMDALTASHEHLAKLITAPRTNKLHRDPKTGKASHSVSTVDLVN